MGRLGVIDGLRGYFLVFMFLNHLTFAGGYLLVRLNHAELGFVQDAQGFVFLSGLLVGVIYARRFAKAGFAGGAWALWRRAADLYAYTVACILAVLVLREFLPGAPRIWDAWLGGIGDDNAFRAAAAALLYQPTYLDILPQYIVYLLAAPPLVWLCMTGRAVWVALGSALLWLAVQLGVHLPLAEGINAGLGSVDAELSMRAAFNVLGWQVIFVEAMVIGVLWAQGKVDFRRFFDPHKTLLVKALAVSLLFFLAFRLGFTFELIPENVMKRFQVYENRQEFGAVFLINFVILAYVMAWLLIAGPQSENRYVSRLARGLLYVFDLSFLRLLGRHSLQIYAWHVVLVYLALWVDGAFGPFNELSKASIALSGIVLLAIPAFYREWRDNRPARVSAGQGA